MTQESRETITNARYPPRPAAVEKIHKEVYEMLEESFGRFLRKSHFNMGRAYQLFCYFLGTFWICASFIPFITSHLVHEELPRRLIRIAGLFPLFFGLFIVDTGRLGVSFLSGILAQKSNIRSQVCPIIYSLTDVASVRQVHPYELATQPPTPREDDPVELLNRAKAALSRKGHDSWDPARPSDLESQLHPHPYQPHHHQHYPTEDEIEPFGPTDRLSATFIHPYSASQHSHSPSVATTATFVPSIIHGHEPKASTSSAIAPFAGGITSQVAGASAFDFDALPTVTFRHPKGKKQILKNPNAKPTGGKRKAKMTTAAFPEVPCFAPLTEVISPIILRLQWEILAKALLLHFVIASVLTGILVSLPTEPFKR